MKEDYRVGRLCLEARRFRDFQPARSNLARSSSSSNWDSTVTTDPESSSTRLEWGGSARHGRFIIFVA